MRWLRELPRGEVRARGESCLGCPAPYFHPPLLQGDICTKVYCKAAPGHYFVVRKGVLSISIIGHQDTFHCDGLRAGASVDELKEHLEKAMAKIADNVLQGQPNKANDIIQKIAKVASWLVRLPDSP
jgi:hypothetical protein